MSTSNRLEIGWVCSLRSHCLSAWTFGWDKLCAMTSATSSYYLLTPPWDMLPQTEGCTFTGNSLRRFGTCQSYPACLRRLRNGRHVAHWTFPGRVWTDSRPGLSRMLHSDGAEQWGAHTRGDEETWKQRRGPWGREDQVAMQIVRFPIT